MSHIAAYGVRDTDFDSAESLNSDDYIAIVQNGVNKKINVDALVRAVAESVDVGEVENVVVAFEVDMDTMHLFMMGTSDETLDDFELNDNGHLVYINN